MVAQAVDTQVDIEENDLVVAEPGGPAKPYNGLLILSQIR
jgi:hypothetical protein